MSDSAATPSLFNTLTPHLIVYDASAAIEFYKRAFGAVELNRIPAPDGKRLIHALLAIGDSHLMLCDEFREWGDTCGRQMAPTSLGGSTATIHVTVPNADAAFEKAVLAGATIIMPVAEMFWGDRYGVVRDPFGHQWSLAHRVKVMTPQQIVEASRKAFPQPA